MDFRQKAAPRHSPVRGASTPAWPLLLLAAVLFFSCPRTPCRAAAPGWWTEGGVSILSGAAEDSAAATQGQVMHMASKARARLDSVLAASGGAGTAVTQLFTDYNAGGVAAKNSRAVTVGQLKHASSLFWLRLREAGAPGVPPAPEWLYRRDGRDIWTQAPGDDRDNALATLGQVKMAFSFDIPAQAPQDYVYRRIPTSSGGYLYARCWPETVTTLIRDSVTYVTSGVLSGDQPLVYSQSGTTLHSVTLAKGTKVTFSEETDTTPNGTTPKWHYVDSGTLAADAGDQAVLYFGTKMVLLKAGTAVQFSTSRRNYTNGASYGDRLIRSGTLSAAQEHLIDNDTGFGGAFESLRFRAGSAVTFETCYYNPVHETPEGTPYANQLYSRYVAMGTLSDQAQPQNPFYAQTFSAPQTRHRVRLRPGTGVSFTMLAFTFGGGNSQTRGAYVTSGVLDEDTTLAYGPGGRNVTLKAGTGVTFSNLEVNSATVSQYVVRGVASGNQTLLSAAATNVQVLDGELIIFRNNYVHSHAPPPVKTDLDGDVLPDAWETANGLSAGSAAGINGRDGDPDGDGLTNFLEWLNGTHPLLADTDGDGVPDYAEVLSGGDPANAADGGAPPPADEMKSLVFKVGGDWAHWKMQIKGTGPDDFRTKSVASPAPGQPEEKAILLRKGNTYEITMEWLGSKEGVSDAWYCWEARIDNWPAEGTFPELAGYQVGPRNTAAKMSVAAENWIIDNNDGVLSTHIHSVGSNVINGKKAKLVPLKVAPDVLAANADFDEAQINPTTGRPLPDCENDTLIAFKKFPWSSQVLGSAVFDDLHEGWFGASPSSLEPSFYTGASVKIAKIIQMDPETGTQESGHVRFWITAGSGTTMQEWKVDPYDRNSPSFTPVELVGLVYGPNATIPSSGSGKRYWIEGTKAGKCTLEFTYTKGALNFKHRQTFEVGCQWTPAQWKEVVRHHVFIESDHSRGGPGADMAGLDITLGFMPNRDRCRAVYQYYGSLFMERQNEFHWLGLAKRAGASVYWGFSDSQYAIENLPTSAIPATVQTATSFQQALLRGMRDIFDDIGWQFMAYHVGGVKEMRFLNDAGAIQDEYLAAWNQMAEGYSQNLPGLVDEASRTIAEQEQRIVLAPSFSAVAAITTLGVPLSWILSKFSVNPVPSGVSFDQFNPNGNITLYNDRWPWIENPWNGMLLKWKQEGIIGRPLLVQPYVEFVAEDLSRYRGFGYSIK